MPNPLEYGPHVNAEILGKTGHLIGEREPEGQEHISGILHEACFLGPHHHERRSRLREGAHNQRERIRIHVRAERPNDDARGPADVLERAALAKELRRNEEALRRETRSTRETRRRPDRQRTADDARGPSRHRGSRLLKCHGDMGHVRVTGFADRSADTDHDEVQAVLRSFRGRCNSPGVVLCRIRLREPWLVDGDSPVGQRCQADSVPFDQHHVVAVLREADRRCDPDVPGADDRCFQPVASHEARLPDGLRSVAASRLAAVTGLTLAGARSAGCRTLDWGPVTRILFAAIHYWPEISGNAPIRRCSPSISPSGVMRSRS